MRTNVGEYVISTAVTAVGEARETMTADQLEVVLDGALARSGVGTEPGLVSGCAARDTRNVRVGIIGVYLGAINGVLEEDTVNPRAALEGGPFVVDAGNGEVTGELNLGNILNCGVEVLGGAIRIDVDEQVRRLDGVGSSAGPSKVVCSRN